MAESLFPCLDLFQSLRPKLGLSLDQYDWLQQAISRGYVQSWDDLERMCRLLWVKPNPSDATATFNRIFKQYRDRHRQSATTTDAQTDPTLLTVNSPTSEPEPTTEPVLGVLPEVPPGRIHPNPDRDRLIPTAIQGTATSSPTQPLTTFSLTPSFRYLPLHPETVQTVWRSLRRRVRTGASLEPDLRATLARIQRQGAWGDIVLRPKLTRQTELVLLVDDSNAMLPFRPALSPLLQAIETEQIKPAKIYRFINYPGDYLYQWQHPTQAIPLTQWLSRLHQNRTVVFIWSDGGAATGRRDPGRSQAIAAFLRQLTPMVRQVLWLNPLPPDRWPHTSAIAIAAELKGAMLPLDAVSLQQAARGKLIQTPLQWLATAEGTR